MDILTNGNDFLSPIHEARTPVEEVATFRVLRSSNGPGPERLWGAFQGGDRLSIRAEGRREAPALTVLDAFFRPIRVESTPASASVTIPSAGVYYLVFAGAVTAEVVRITRRRPLANRSGLADRLIAWVKERLGGGAASAGPGAAVQGSSFPSELAA